MIKLTENEARILLECAKIGLDNLTNGVVETTKDRLDLMNVEQVLRFCQATTYKAPPDTYKPSIQIKVTGKRVAGLNGKKWKLEV